MLEAKIIISKDTGSLGLESGIAGKDYVYVELSSQSKFLYTTATNFEFIEYQGVKTSINDFKSNDIHDVIFAKIFSRTVDDDIKSFVTLQNNMITVKTPVKLDGGKFDLGNTPDLLPPLAILVLKSQNPIWIYNFLPFNQPYQELYSSILKKS